MLKTSNKDPPYKIAPKIDELHPSEDPQKLAHCEDLLDDLSNRNGYTAEQIQGVHTDSEAEDENSPEK